MPGIFWNGLVRLSNVFSEIKKKNIKTWSVPFSPECCLDATSCTKEKQFVFFFSVNSRVKSCAACERSGLAKRVWRSRLTINTLIKVHWLLKHRIAPCNHPSVTSHGCPPFGKNELVMRAGRNNTVKRRLHLC